MVKKPLKSHSLPSSHLLVMKDRLSRQKKPLHTDTPCWKALKILSPILFYPHSIEEVESRFFLKPKETCACGITLVWKLHQKESFSPILIPLVLMQKRSQTKREPCDDTLLETLLVDLHPS
ncbi:hypothetical protein AVEN_275102-1 [Araneus ventricosus]|uniref:Uncharacterized protein n=1 Tax=Araneus ventricosus TaxID=182803 RepID=A0A4Y2VGN8_ARAVE|nr:hypothetical protein AVEN_275102-1 [Araneus ventricosus]